MVRVALGIPETFHTSERDRFTGDESLAILLSRLAYPCRLFDLQSKWGRSEAALSRCVSDLSDFLFDRWKHLFRYRPAFYTPDRLEHYAACIVAAGSPLDDIWGFIDGTVLEICRPGDDQGVVYNGHKRHHALKFQAVVSPDGLMGPIFGPVEGRRADSGILEMSGLEDICVTFAQGSGGRQLFVYGDPAYGTSNAVISGVKRIGDLTEDEREFNRQMSKVRQSVEWGFGNVIKNFSFVDYDKSLRLGLQPVGQLYLLAILFTNIRTLLYSSEVSQKFQCAPPTLHEYLFPGLD